MKLLHVLIGLLGLHAVNGDKPIRCFQCSFDENYHQCDDPFHVTGVHVTHNCTGSCVKVKIYNKKEDHVYGRYCLPEEQVDGCREVNTGVDKKMRDCYCNSDLCNSAPSHLAPPVYLLCVAIVMSMFRIYMY